MKGDKIKIAVIYVLIFVIIALVGYLIYFVVSQNDTKVTTPKDEVDTPVKKNDVAEGCTFNVTMSEFGTLADDSNSLQTCTGLTKFNIENITLDGKTIDLYAVYSNTTSKSDAENSGIYLQNRKILSSLTSTEKVRLGIFDNKLFVLSSGEEATNVMAYNSNGGQVYNLSKSLAEANISDPAFVELAKTNPNLSAILDTNHIDGGSFIFADGKISFSSDSKLGCINQGYKGSNYTITYIGDKFNAPEFVSTISCNQ